MSILTHKDVRGIAAMVPTPCLEDGGGWDTANSVDLEETANVAQGKL